MANLRCTVNNSMVSPFTANLKSTASLKFMANLKLTARTKSMDKSLLTQLNLRPRSMARLNHSPR